MLHLQSKVNIENYDMFRCEMLMRILSILLFPRCHLAFDVLSLLILLTSSLLTYSYYIDDYNSSHFSYSSLLEKHLHSCLNKTDGWRFETDLFGVNCNRYSFYACYPSYLIFKEFEFLLWVTNIKLVT